MDRFISAARRLLDRITGSNADSTSEPRPHSLSQSLDTCYHVLSNARRRWGIEELTDGPLDLQEIATRIAAHENEKPADELTKAEQQRVYISLYQSHIPRLDADGFVIYDSETETVELTEDGHALRSFFDNPTIPDDKADQPTLDTVFFTLKNERRRALLRYLREQPSPVPLREASVHVAADIADIAPDEVSDDQRQRTYIGLYQSHIPQLVESDAVNWDRESNEIELTSLADRFFDYPLEEE